MREIDLTKWESLCKLIVLRITQRSVQMTAGFNDCVQGEVTEKNKLASDLGGAQGVVKPNIIGELKIVSESPYCTSCQGIIQQFHVMFPNVKLILVDGAK